MVLLALAMALIPIIGMIGAAITVALGVAVAILYRQLCSSGSGSP